MPRVRPPLDHESSLRMRKRPQQHRAHGTVAAIKRATLEMIAAEGLSACGTDRIARQAGISIGALYKYFPNREAILKALYEDVSIEHARTIDRLTLQILDLPTEQGMELTMRAVVAMHEKNHLVLLQLVSDVPELRLESQPLAFHNLVRNNIRAYVQHRNYSLKPREIAHRCFFIERIVFSCLQGYIGDMPVGMSRRKFAKNLGHLVSSIIDAPA